LTLTGLQDGVGTRLAPAVTSIGAPFAARSTLLPRNYLPRDIKLLFALSQNRCAFPGCDNPIVADATDADEAAVVGHIAHIVASSVRGPRGDPAFPQEDLDREPNLVLLCAHHHALVDAQHSTYTVEDLRRWKEAHTRERPPQHASTEAGASVRMPIPSQVPGPPKGFVNRATDLDRLDSLTRQPDASGGPAVVVLTGAHGVGKTAMSRYWAHLNRDRFEDGQLHVDFADLRHHGGVAVGDVLGGFLTAFGLPGEMIPPDLRQRSDLFRSSTSKKRVLLLLDDAEHAAEVTPLIPNAPESVVVIAGRAQLPELIYDRARPMSLHRLDLESAEELLSKMIGEERVRNDPGGVAELKRFCDGLPVALRVCGGRLELNDQRPISWLVEQLADEAVRLERISWGPGDSLDVVFNDAYRALSHDERRLYRRLGVHPGRSFTPALAAAAARVPLATATSLLDRLAAAHLVEDTGERYRFHDLLRIHARRCAQRDESDGQREAVLRRIVDFYLGSTRAVDFAITPTRLRLAEAPSREVEGVPPLRSSEDGFAWFEAERPNLLAILRSAAEREWDSDVWRICEALWPCYFNRKPYAEWIETHELAVVAAQRSGHLAAEARMRSALAKALTETGDHARAERELTTAKRLAGRSGHAVLQASILDFRGHLDLDRGRFRDARAAYEGARAAFEALGVTRGVALEDYHLGRALAALGEHELAVESYVRATDLINPVEDELLLGRTLIYLAESYQAVGETQAAVESLNPALEIMSRNGLRYYEARAHEVLALLASETGDPDDAAEHWHLAHAIYDALSSPRARDVAPHLGDPGGAESDES